MCMITFLPEGSPADSQAIFNGTIFNDDGHGFAIVINGELVVRRGLDAVSMVDTFVDLRSKHPEGPAMFHSRMATHGATDKGNIHPFYVGNDRRTVLVHNGIFSTLGTKTSVWSDTKIFAKSFLPSRHDMNLLTRRGRIRAQKWMGSYNKIAVITTNPRSKVSSFILNENEGYWDDGAWYSGLDYLGAKYRYSGGYYSGGTSYYGAAERDPAAWFDDEEYEYDTRAGYVWAKDDDGVFRFRKEESDTRAIVLGSDKAKDAATDDDRWAEYWEEYVRERGKCSFCDAVGTIDKHGVCAICVMCNDCSQPEQFCVCV